MPHASQCWDSVGSRSDYNFYSVLPLHPYAYGWTFAATSASSVALMAMTAPRVHLVVAMNMCWRSHVCHALQLANCIRNAGLRLQQYWVGLSKMILEEVVVGTVFGIF